VLTHAFKKGHEIDAYFRILNLSNLWVDFIEEASIPTLPEFLVALDEHLTCIGSCELKNKFWVSITMIP
jgi:hypothetical protein